MDKAKWKLIKWGLGLLSLYLGWRLRKTRGRRPFDVVLIDAVMRGGIRKLEGAAFSPEDEARYRKVLRNVTFWHGTGRYQYRNEEVVDVFEEILDRGGLRPAKDIFDPKLGEMMSISVARQRMYARIYADMHVYRGVKRSERYGMPRFWAYYFIMASILQVVKELKVWSPLTYLQEVAAGREKVNKYWSIKVTRHPARNAGRFFNNGSDIPGNFPILIGVRTGEYGFLETSEGIELYESRVGRVIPAGSFTHLEVPEDKVVEVVARLELHGLKLPVLGFEQCEQFFAQQRFSQLVSRSVLVRI